MLVHGVAAGYSRCYSNGFRIQREKKRTKSKLVLCSALPIEPKRKARNACRRVSATGDLDSILSSLGIITYPRIQMIDVMQPQPPPSQDRGRPHGCAPFSRFGNFCLFQFQRLDIVYLDLFIKYKVHTNIIPPLRRCNYSQLLLEPSKARDSRQ